MAMTSKRKNICLDFGCPTQGSKTFVGGINLF